MTTPKVNTIKRAGSRLYVHPETNEKVPGVTSILGMLPKGFLKFWAAKSVAQAAVDNLGEIVGITLKAGPDAAVDFLKRSPDRDTRQAAEAGSEVHDLYERLARGEHVGRVHPDLEVYVAHFEKFVEEFEPDFMFLEETIWSEEHNYAGSFDFIAEITDPDEKERVLVVGDWKTTRSGVHEEVALQLAAYKNADYIIRPDGGRVPMPKVSAGVVVHARPEALNVVPARVDDDVFETFLHLRQVWEWDQTRKKSVLGEAVNIDGTMKRKRRAIKKVGA